MRAFIQRVSKSSVSIDDQIHSSIGQGLMILLGIEITDEKEDADWLCKKISQMRIFSDEEGKMNLDIKDVDGEILVVSQFTLLASTKKGNRPSYIKAARPEQAIPLYEYFVDQMRISIGKEIKTGSFGAMMQVDISNDGPVSIWIDSQNKE